MREDVQLVRTMGGAALGGVLTGVSKHFPTGIEHTRDAAVDRAIGSLREVTKTAEDEGVTLCVEVVNRFESPLVNTCVEALRVAEAVDSPCLGVHLDTFHMNIEEASVGKAIRLAGKRLVHFHVCENNRALPGQGHIDWIGGVRRAASHQLPRPYRDGSPARPLRQRGGEAQHLAKAVAGLWTASWLPRRAFCGKGWRIRMAFNRFSLIAGALCQSGDRFLRTGYKEQTLTVPEVLRAIGARHVASGVEIHHRGTEDEAYTAKLEQALSDSRLRPTFVNTWTYGERQWRFGSLSAPDAATHAVRPWLAARQP